MGEGVSGGERVFLEILSLCLRARCPVCAQGRLFKPITRLGSLSELFLPPERCDSCGFRFRREPGYYFGVLTPVLPMLSVGTGLLFAAAAFLFWRPEDPLELLWPAALGVALGFVGFFRPAIAIFVSLDHAIDPPAGSAEQDSS